MAKTAGEMVAAAKAEIDNLSVDDFDRERTQAVVVDLREAEEWNAHGTIPGAIPVSRGMLEFAADPATPYYKREFQPDARMLLYCAAGSRSALAAKTLKEMGYGNVAHLEDGFKGWVAAGKPVK